MTKAHDYALLYERAYAAGAQAGKEHAPTPMNLVGHVAGERREYHVPSGPCGFAWVTVRPGTSSFARWLRATGRGRSDRYAGGTVVWIRDHGQSWEKKTAHAMKMAEVLADAGICASYGERLD